MLLERIPELKIREAMENADFDILPGTCKPISAEKGMELVSPKMRMAYRVLMNAGDLPEEVRLRREIVDISALLSDCDMESVDQRALRKRLHFLIQKIAESGHGKIALQTQYIDKLATKID